MTDTSLISHKGIIEKKTNTTDVENLASTLKALNDRMDGLKDKKTVRIEEDEDTNEKEEIISIEEKFNSSLKDLAKEIRQVNSAVNENLPDVILDLIPATNDVKEEKLVNKR